jgi:3,2-trans-enoyl-CoA isomerase
MLEIIQHGSVRELRLARAPVNALNTELISALDAAIELAETEAAA